MAAIENRYRLYVDESGTHQLPRGDVEQDRFLGLVGCVIGHSNYRAEFLPELNRIKAEIFGDDPDSPVVLHREDVLRKRGPFEVLTDNDLRDDFNRQVVGFYRDQSYVIIAAVLDKLKHKRKYGQGAFHPYHFCFTLVAERFAMFLNRKAATGDMIVECRGKAEDLELQSTWDRFHASGSRFMKSFDVRKCMAKGALKFRRKHDNVAGLQLADMLAYDVKRDILIEAGLQSAGSTQDCLGT